MADEVRWVRDDHTEAKHRVLRAYVDAWFPVMAQQALKVNQGSSEGPRLLVVDGFAGPGRYKDGQPGSPLILLEALLAQPLLPRWGAVTFMFLFIEQDERRAAALEAELDALEASGVVPSNVRWEVKLGAFEDTFGPFLEPAESPGWTLVPTFAFIDPFGYTQASMAFTGRLLSFRRCESLFFIPLDQMHRFVAREGQDRAMDSFFGTDHWREAIELEGEERREFLAQLFVEQLEKNPFTEHTAMFRLRTSRGADYRLVFALGHDKGMWLAKDAMWTVDPVSGTGFSATTPSGQDVLFADEVDTTPLLAVFRDEFGDGRWFTYQEAERVALKTPFRQGQINKATLGAAIKRKEIERVPATGSLKTARMRFVS